MGKARNSRSRAKATTSRGVASTVGAARETSPKGIAASSKLGLSQRRPPTPSAMTNELPTSAKELFHFDDGKPSFDDLARPNGIKRWSARQLMQVLGYDKWASFRLVVNKAIATCTTINAEVSEHFVQANEDAGAPNFKLSRFACYLVAMQGDPKKPEVALAQAYFAALAQAFQDHVQSCEDVARLDIRAELSEHEKTLHGAAKAHGVVNYAFFQDAGYRGLYNKSLTELRRHKGDPSGGKKPLLDFMGKRELAANLFRITETEAKIKRDQVQGQNALQAAARNVGAAVRKTMIENGGEAPEDLPLEPDVALLKSGLKKASKGLSKADRQALPPKTDDPKAKG